MALPFSLKHWPHLASRAKPRNQQFVRIVPERFVFGKGKLVPHSEKSQGMTPVAQLPFPGERSLRSRKMG